MGDGIGVPVVEIKNPLPYHVDVRRSPVVLLCVEEVGYSGGGDSR